MQRDTKVGIAIGVLLVALVVIFWWAQQADNMPPVPPVDGTSMTATGITQPPGAPTGGSDAAIDSVAVDVAALLDRAAESLNDTADNLREDTDGTEVGHVTSETVDSTPAVSAQRTHVVRSGETLTSISKLYYGTGNKWSRIHEANRSLIPNKDRLKVGMKLTIPGVAGESVPEATVSNRNAAASGTQRHTVRRGESLRSIAKRYYGTEGGWKRIHKANRARIGDDPRKLKIGVVLVVPPAAE